MPDKIIEDLKTFADKLVTCIAADTEEGQEQLIKIFKQAKKKYNNEDSTIWSWVYSLSRKRSEDFDHTIEALSVFPKPKVRLQEFLKFFSMGKGKWESTSANTELFLLLINSVSGYEKETDGYLHSTIISPLRKLLVERIQELLKQYEINDRRAAEREKELELMRKAKVQEPETTHLFNDEEQAKLFAIKNPDHQVLYLNTSLSDSGDMKWELKWIDFTGKATVLGISDHLASLLKLVGAELKSLSALSADGGTQKLLAELLNKSASAREIRTEVKKILRLALDKIPLLINPSSSQLDNSLSTFVFNQHNKPIGLYWYNLGNFNPILLKDYPELEKWMGNTSFSDSNVNEVMRLKVYLRDIHVRRSVDESKQNKIQSLLKQTHGVALIATDDLATIPAYKLIKDTYLLTRVSNNKSEEESTDSTTGEWVLYQRQRGGVNARVNIKTWANADAMEAFEKILKTNENVSAGNLSVEAKEKLRECIKQSTVVTQKVSCQAINEFFPKKETNFHRFKPCSFIITREINNDAPYYQLYYIDIVQKCIKVDMREYPEKTMALLSTWDCKPEELNFSHLSDLAKTLVDFKPAVRINMAQFSALESVLGKKRVEKVNKEISTASQPSETTEKEQKESGKLDISKFAIATLFGHKSSTVKTEVEGKDIPSEEGATVLGFSD
ncbi:hypothetical protein [Legionella cardiaca]|uniref:Dot/Icm T4SS effector n=1 Tax=Legionella cardiaca TaxID=1071983 RepID=A0ABY8AMM5_9GAMM|nr:hypothetical protein [Legionella cardiaca]WED41944.1 hypothetical protein PXX05_08340 [Legionella cardiaca]